MSAESQIHNCKYRQLSDWFTHSPGLLLADAERREFGRILPNLFGYHILQLSTGMGGDLLSTSRIAHRTVLCQDALPEAHIGLVARPEALPIATDSVDVLVLPHTLEFSTDPHQVLREADRVLVPEGHVVITAFSPLSFWGIWRLLHRRRQRVPWCGRFIGQTRLKDWLALLGFEIVLTRGCFYRPPLRHAGLMQRLEFLERIGTRGGPLPSSVYLVVARKRVSTLTPIKPRWSPRRRLVAAGLTENSQHRRHHG